MKRNWKRFLGFGALALVMVLTAVMSSVWGNAAQAYGGPNGNRGAGMSTGTPCATCTENGQALGTGNQNRMQAGQMAKGNGQGMMGLSLIHI